MELFEPQRRFFALLRTLDEEPTADEGLDSEESSRATALIRIFERSCDVWVPLCPSMTAKKR